MASRKWSASTLLNYGLYEVECLHLNFNMASKEWSASTLKYTWPPESGMTPPYLKHGLQGVECLFS